MHTIFMLIGLLFSSLSSAEEGNAYNLYSWQITDRFKMTQVRPWKDFYLTSMRYMMVKSERNDSDNTFCTIGYNLHDEQGQKYRETVVFWDKRQLIIRWQLEEFDLSDVTMKARTMAGSPFISYGAVLPRDSITMGMMNYYAKEDVDRIRVDCERNGEIITVKAFPTPEECKINIVSYDCAEKLLEL